MPDFTWVGDTSSVEVSCHTLDSPLFHIPTIVLHTQVRQLFCDPALGKSPVDCVSWPTSANGGTGLAAGYWAVETARRSPLLTAPGNWRPAADRAPLGRITALEFALQGCEGRHRCQQGVWLARGRRLVPALGGGSAGHSAGHPPARKRLPGRKGRQECFHPQE